MLNDLKEIWNYRELLRNMVWRDLRARYKGSVLGFFWSFVNPLLTLAVYSALFTFVLPLGIPSYALFLFVALLPWMFTQSSVQRCTNVIIHNGNLVKKIYFPREILPISVVLSGLMNYLYGVVVLVPVLWAFHIPLRWVVIFFPVILALQFFFTLAISLLSAALTVYFRDLEHIIGIALMAWFYLTPIVYPVTRIPEKYSKYFWLNPLTPLMVSYRNIFFEGKTPPIRSLALVTVESVILLGLGFYVFSRLKRKFAEEL